MNTCWSHSLSNKEILNPQTQHFTSSCKSFVLSICFPPFFLLHDLCDVSAPPTVVVLLYLETLSWGFLHSCFSRDSLHLGRQKERKAVFITECIRGPGSPDLPLSVKRAMRAYFPSPGSSPPQTQRGEGQFCIFAQLCFPRFTQTGKAASQNCQPELEIARMGKVGRDFMPKFEV